MGDMARKRQEIIAQLKAEGVFDLQKELTLPLFAQRVAVVSSEQAAGYGDFLRQLQDNDAGLSFDVQLFPAVMQGEKVEQSVINALNQINDQVDKFDVVVIIRGGGATSDLSGFDTILLAENVANFPLPIITGIGHDRDESVLDMISFQRVKTPTAAASYLVEHLRNTWHRIDDAEQEIIQTVRHAMELEKNRFDLLTSKIPFLFSRVKLQQLTHLQQCQQRLTTSARLHVHQAQQHIEVHSARLFPTVQRLLLDTRHHLNLLEQRCSLLDPQLLLKRGYSITLHQGRAVRNAHQLKAGDEIETRVEKGIIKSTVK